LNEIRVGDFSELHEKLRISNIRYQSVEDKFPINTALKTLLLEETLKQSRSILFYCLEENDELEEFDKEKFSIDELKRKMQLREEVENQIRLEYRRKCYFEYSDMKSLNEVFKDKQTKQ
jgi:hypothetical protein